MNTLIFCLLSLLQLLHVATAGAVGGCRTECVEQNTGKIVRVHLKGDLVMVGICTNVSTTSGVKSTVTPFICNRNNGVWSHDHQDGEGIVGFEVACPTPSFFSERALAACPTSAALDPQPVDVLGHIDTLRKSNEIFPSDPKIPFQKL